MNSPTSYIDYRKSLIQNKDVYNLAGPYQQYVDMLYNLSFLDERYEELLEELLHLLMKYVRKEKHKKNNNDASLLQAIDLICVELLITP